jgi:hypothetical protein
MTPHEVLCCEQKLPEGYPLVNCYECSEPAKYYWCSSYLCKDHLDKAKHRLAVALGLADGRPDRV